MLQLVPATVAETPSETKSETPLETPRWPRKKRITFSPDPDGRKSSVVLIFPSPEVEDKFVSSIVQSAKKTVNGRKQVNQNDKIIDKIEEFLK